MHLGNLVLADRGLFDLDLCRGEWNVTRGSLRLFITVNDESVNHPPITGLTRSIADIPERRPMITVFVEFVGNVNLFRLPSQNDFHDITNDRSLDVGRQVCRASDCDNRGPTNCKSRFSRCTFAGTNSFAQPDRFSQAHHPGNLER